MFGVRTYLSVTWSSWILAEGNDGCTVIRLLSLGIMNVQIYSLSQCNKTVPFFSCCRTYRSSWRSRENGVKRTKNADLRKKVYHRWRKGCRWGGWKRQKICVKWKGQVRRLQMGGHRRGNPKLNRLIKQSKHWSFLSCSLSQAQCPTYSLIVKLNKIIAVFN